MPLMMVLVFWSIYEIYCSESSSYSPDYSLMISEYKRYSSIFICFLLSKSTASCTFSTLALYSWESFSFSAFYILRICSIFSFFFLILSYFSFPKTLNFSFYYGLIWLSILSFKFFFYWVDMLVNSSGFCWASLLG
jgi:hypothetical protein